MTSAVIASEPAYSEGIAIVRLAREQAERTLLKDQEADELVIAMDAQFVGS